MTESDFKILLAKIDQHFLVKKVGSQGDEFITQGTLLAGSSIADIKKIVKKEPYSIEFQSIGDDLQLKVKYLKPIVIKFPKIPRVNLILFILTIFTTLLAGAIMEGINPLKNPMGIITGWPFSVTLMLILGFHEFGHYYFARKHHVIATLPYFIPAPTFIGTFGAFIKIKSPIYRKDALLQIGAAGPIAGFIVAVPALIIGLSLSQVVAISSAEMGITLGDSILMKFLLAIIFPNLQSTQDVLLHPIAFAGWIGLLVTMLNLLPIGQLDGGHIAYAMLGRKHAKVAKFALLALIPMGLLSLNWLVWAALILLLMRTTKHPPVNDVDVPLSEKNKRIGYVCLAIFVLCFIPIPFS
ncbi:site-2 protease family protein [bacterium]|nr:site-2 protease family protein [bacterium]